VEILPYWGPGQNTYYLFQRDSTNETFSIWIFMLLGMEAIKTYRANPYFELGTTRIPTWTTPLILVVLVFVLIPHTSLLGHLCGLGVGYLCQSRYTV
jgi:hypothetical protein